MSGMPLDNNGMLFVDFKTYCEQCRYSAQPDAEDPCNDCLSSVENKVSRIPVYFEKSIET